MSQLSYDDVLQFILGGKTLIAVNSRLKDKLALRYAGYCQENQFKKVWIKPKIFTLEEKLTEIWHEYELSAPNVPVMLTKEQERALWASIIQTHYPEGFIQLSKITSLVMQAWRHLHLWDISDYFEKNHFFNEITEDAKKFIIWAQLFKKQLHERQWITASQRASYFILHPEILLNFTQVQSWILLGFDDLPPIYNQLLSLISYSQANLNISLTHSYQISFKTAAEEYEIAAKWAKTLVDKGEKNIGIVHPELAMHRQKIEDIFMKIFYPEQKYAAEKIMSNQFSLSAGTPLGSQTMVKVALKILNITQQKYLSLAEIDFMLRHMYLNNNLLEQAENLRIINLIKENGRTIWSLEELYNWLLKQTESTQILNLIQKLKQNNNISITEKASTSVVMFLQKVKAGLLIFDFPGARVLSSLEYQIMVHFYQALESFSKLSLIFIDKKYSEYLSELEEYLNFIPFQAETGDVPVNIMGVLEGAGQLFSHLWVMGMNNQNWPASPEPNPFLPYLLQREKAMPHASAEREYALAIKMTERLKHSAEAVIFSFSQYDEDKLCLPSECIRELTGLTIDKIKLNYETQIVKTFVSEKIEDNIAPKVDKAEKIAGGTRILKSQAACPFKGFAEARLKLKSPPQELILGLSVMERGTLLHDILDKTWEALKDHQTLLSYSSQALELLIQEKIKASIVLFQEKEPNRLGKIFWQNETINLTKVLMNWLNLEKKREPFKVLLRECWQSIIIDDLSLSLRIDRIDLTESGEAILIDYKTGEASFSSCFGERLNEPQLPIYCLLETDYAPLGVAFGVIKPTGECDFIGITYSEKVLPEIKSIESQKKLLAKYGITCQETLNQDPLWQALLNYWRYHLSVISTNFLSGDALVSPKNGVQTCRTCHLSTLCRIKEKML